MECAYTCLQIHTVGGGREGGKRKRRLECTNLGVLQEVKKSQACFRVGGSTDRRSFWMQGQFLAGRNKNQLH